MQQEVVLAMLAKEPSHGYELRARLRQALGPLGEALNPGQVYVTLTRLEKAGLVVSDRSTGLAERPDRKVYMLTPDGQQRVAEWLADVGWPKPDLAEFHLKLVAAAAAGLADPLSIVDTQRCELLRRLRDAQRAALAEPENSDAVLLLDGIVLRLQATCAGWRRANRTGPAEGGDHETHHRHKRARQRRRLGAAGPRAPQALRPRTGTGTRRRRRRPRCRGRRVGGRDGAQRLRQVHAAAPDGRLGPALGRRGVAGGSAHRPAGGEGPGPDAAQRRRFRVPGLPSDGRAHRKGERRAVGAAGRTLTPGGTTTGR